jgi:phosphate transport system substrate-binding protein
VIGVAALTLCTTLGIGAIVVTPGGAATSKSVPTLGQDETQLSSFEALSTAGFSPPLTEAGSSLFYPLWEEWSGSTSPAPPVAVHPGAGGSGLGQSEAESGTINIGASDGFLPAATITGPPAVLNIPVVVSAQGIVYNLPGLSSTNHLELNATVLNNIYAGKIVWWNAKAIRALNPKVKLPHQKIIPVRRLDSSGDTFIFTSYLYYGDPTSFTDALGGPALFYSTWPSVAAELAESGNSGIEAALKANEYSVGYLGVSYLPGAETGNPVLGVAELENGSGHYVLPTVGTIENEVRAYPTVPADGALSLIDSTSAPYGYPIVNFEYAIVLENQPSTAAANAIKAELAWGMDPRYGASKQFISPVGFKSLPLNALAVAINLLNQIT